jgi:hypothetical protein
MFHLNPFYSGGNGTNCAATDGQTQPLPVGRTYKNCLYKQCQDDIAINIELATLTAITWKHCTYGIRRSHGNECDVTPCSFLGKYSITLYSEDGRSTILQNFSTY